LHLSFGYESTKHGAELTSDLWRQLSLAKSGSQHPQPGGVISMSGHEGTEILGRYRLFSHSASELRASGSHRTRHN
jgi:hypothetical protein